MFLIPALIVAGLVLLFLLGDTLSAWVNRILGRGDSDSRSAAEFLRNLDSDNPEVRWRAASDLAQVLLRKDGMASDVPFALQLADRLDRALKDSADAEKSYAERSATLSDADRGKELKKLDPERTYSTYLAACLGNFMVPVGAPLLKKMAVQETGMEPDALAERRRRALFALATLGKNLERFDALPAEKQDAVLEKLQEAAKEGNHSAWARKTHDYLRQRRKDRADTLGVADVLIKCADDEDPSLRMFAAFAMNFWYGTTAENTRMEAALVKLCNDSGRGEDKLAERLEKNPEQTRELYKKPGFRVQPNAAIALARRGSPRARLDLLEEMLDPEKLRTILVLRRKNGSEEPNEALVVHTVAETLKALVQMHRKLPEDTRLAKRFGPIVDGLAENGNVVIRTEAKQAQLAFRGKE
jgi:hypothetical protein